MRGGTRRRQAWAMRTPSASRVAVLGAVLLVATALTATDASHTMMLRLIAAGREVIVAHPVLGPVAFVGLATLSAVLAFFSSAVLVPSAVMAWGAVPTTLYLLTGWMLGGLAMYLLARTVGRPALRWVAPRRHLEDALVHMTEGMSWGMVVLFQVALPSELPGFVLGLARYPVLRYVAALGIAELPYAVGTVLLGVSFMEGRAWMLLVTGAIAIAALAVLVPRLRALVHRAGGA